MKTDTSEKGLESLIVAAMVGQAAGEPPPLDEGVSLIRERYGGTGWIPGQAEDYDREFCVDLPNLSVFLHATQPKVAEALDLANDSPTRRRFLARLQGEISKRGVIDVLRHGIKDGPHHVELFFGTPSSGNEKAQALYAATVSLSPANSATVGMKHSVRLTWRCSLTVWRSPHLNSKTA